MITWFFWPKAIHIIAWGQWACERHPRLWQKDFNSLKAINIETSLVGANSCYSQENIYSVNCEIFMYPLWGNNPFWSLPRVALRWPQAIICMPFGQKKNSIWNAKNIQPYSAFPWGQFNEILMMFMKKTLFYRTIMG